jgi:hypothetical protein
MRTAPRPNRRTAPPSGGTSKTISFEVTNALPQKTIGRTRPRGTGIRGPGSVPEGAFMDAPSPRGTTAFRTGEGTRERASRIGTPVEKTHRFELGRRRNPRQAPWHKVLLVHPGVLPAGGGVGG